MAAPFSTLFFNQMNKNNTKNISPKNEFLLERAGLEMLIKIKKQKVISNTSNSIKTQS